ncbi:MAG: cupin [Azonexus sp.]|nr:cupin [Betaproteobacteria bacterium]MBK8918176.1 cupin [Betaproteobacteria bacterium]MBP6035393.1 cupin [Azonexus sp.]MBP6906032.1 cupin [Azonexus sp.]
MASAPGAGNLLTDLPAPGGEEHFAPLFARPGLKVERIVSTGQASPPGFWYDQAWDEWVVLLQGAARLRFADEAAARPLGPGDFIAIAARRRHRIEWTDPHQATVWLAIHAQAPDGT